MSALFRAFDLSVLTSLTGSAGTPVVAAAATHAPASSATKLPPPAARMHAPTIAPTSTTSHTPYPACPADSSERTRALSAVMDQTQPMHTRSEVPVESAEPAAKAADWVLVVDDSATVREFMKSKLAPFQLNVDFAENGEQAVGLAGQKHYTCIFLDVVMPGIDGYYVCKLIKAKRGVTKSAVVMLTSKSSSFDKIRGAMAGCDAYLTKPVHEEKLLETIVKFLPTP